MRSQEQIASTKQRIRESAEIHLARRILAEGQVKVWPVGGVVRDFLRGKVPSDLDLVVALRQSEEVRDYVQRLAQRLGGTLVRLDGYHGYWRLAGLPQGHLDFAALQADTIEEDLKVRDFTLNSIAWDLDKEDFIDPYCGVEDCLCGVLRTVSEQALRADPLRNLRAWRFLSAGMHPSPELAEQVKRQVPWLAQVAAERTNEELSRIFKGDIAGTWEFACSTGLVKVLWPGLVGRENIARARLSAWQARRETGLVLTSAFAEALQAGERCYWDSELRCDRTRFLLLGLALAVGLESAASDPESVAVGPESVAVGSESVAVGPESVAVGPESVTVGPESVAVGQESVAVGPESVAVGPESVAVGPESVAVGPESVAVGPESVAVGPESVSVKRESGIETNAVAGRLALGRRETQLLELMLREGEAAARLLRITASAGEWHDFFQQCGAESLGVLGYAALAYEPGHAANLEAMVADWLNQGAVSAPRLAVTTKQLLARFPQVQGPQVGHLVRHLARLNAERGGLSAEATYREAERWLQGYRQE